MGSKQSKQTNLNSPRHRSTEQGDRSDSQICSGARQISGSKTGPRSGNSGNNHDTSDGTFEAEALSHVLSTKGACQMKPRFDAGFILLKAR